MSKPRLSNLRCKEEDRSAALNKDIRPVFLRAIGWEELLRIEAQVRKRKQATDHRRAEIKELLITITIVGLALLAGVGGLALLAYFLVIYDQR
jgi:hypothetical protein